MEKRLGVIGIVIEDRESSAGKVNEILYDFSALIAGRMGLPYRERQVAVIALIVDGTTDEIGAMTGRLGAVPGVNVRSALARK